MNAKEKNKLVKDIVDDVMKMIYEKHPEHKRKYDKKTT